MHRLPSKSYVSDRLSVINVYVTDPSKVRVLLVFTSLSVCVT